jgi:hypothetical protein
LRFGVDLFTVNHNIKDAATAGYQLCISTKILFEFGSQPDRLGFVVSHGAVVDFYLHKGPPVGYYIR